MKMGNDAVGRPPYLNPVPSSSASEPVRSERYVTVTSRGSGGGGDLEARVSVLEANVGHIKSDVSDIKSDVRDIRDGARSDFRLLFGALITTALGLAYLMARGFGWL